jgi:Ca2+/H+ antiporter, TMEM165/GDT1 family
VEQFLVAFFVSFGVIFVAETGDKSQLMAMTFAARYRAIPVLVGITLATAVTHAVSVAIGYGLGASLPVGWIGLAAGLAFLGFAAWTLRGDELTADEQAKADRSTSSAVVAAAVAFFLAELGDKTMLATITLATQHGWAGTWVGSTLGMVLADALAIALGAHLSRRLSERTIRIGSASLFAVFGVVLLAEATGELVGRSLPSILATVIDHHVGGWIALGLMLAVTITALTGVFDVTHRRVRVARSILVAQVALGALLAIVSTVLVGADVVQPVGALYDARTALIGASLAVLGLGLGVRAVARRGAPAGARRAPAASGLYSRIRHPDATGVLAATMGVAMMTPTPLMAIAVALLVVGIQLDVHLVREPELEWRLGGAYDAYRQRTGRFVPRLREAGGPGCER